MAAAVIGVSVILSRFAVFTNAPPLPRSKDAPNTMTLADRFTGWAITKDVLEETAILTLAKPSTTLLIVASERLLVLDVFVL